MRSGLRASLQSPEEDCISNSATRQAYQTGLSNGDCFTDSYGTRKSPQLDKPGFSQINLVFLQINLVFLQINLVYLKKPHFSGEKPGLSEILER